MKKFFYLFALIATLAFSSCEHKELYYGSTHTANVKVIFDWKKAPDAAPKTMSLYLFPGDGGPVQRYEFTDRTGGIVKIPVGNYNVLCLNSDSELIQLRGISRWETFEAYTGEERMLGSLGIRSGSVPGADGTGTEKISLAPDMLWSDRAKNIEITLLPAEQAITLYPGESVCSYTVEIRNASNLKYVSDLSGALSGMAGGLLPGPDELTTERVTVPFNTVSDGISTITGNFLTFGSSPTIGNTNRLVIYAILADGSKWYYTYDVTSQVRSAPDKRHVRIVLDGLPLPKPIANGGGFQPSVDDWKNVNVDIPM